MAVTRYWVGTGADTAWTSVGNWSNASGGSGGYSAPVAGDTAIFDAAASGACTLTASISVATLNMTGYAGTLSVGNSNVSISSSCITGGTINMGGWLWRITNATLDISLGTINRQTSTVECNGASTLIGAIGKYLYNINISSSASVTVTGRVTCLMRLQVDASGTITCDAPHNLYVSGWITLAASSTITGSGTLTVQGDASSRGITTKHSLSTLNINTLNLTYWATAGTLAPGTYASTTINIQATSALATQILRLSAGSYTLGGNNSTVTVSSTYASGSMTLDAGTNSATLYIGGHLTITPTAGTVALTGSVAIRGNATINAGTYTKTAGTITMYYGTNQTCHDLTTGALIFASNGTVHTPNPLTAASLRVDAYCTWDPDSAAHTFSGLAQIKPLAQVDATGLGGCSITAGSIDWQGTAGAWLDLAASTSWTLNVSGAANVSYAEVRRSNASGGNTIVAPGCDDQGANTNWIFTTYSPEAQSGHVYVPGAAAAQSYSPGATAAVLNTSGAAAAKSYVPR